MPIHRTDVHDVTSAVCRALLGDQIDLVPTGTGRPSLAPRVAATVSIRGAWHGAVLVRLAPELALRFTRELLQIEPGSSDDPDVTDVVKELANMIGGNLKGLLPEPCTLSLPSLDAPPGFSAEGECEGFVVDGHTLEVIVIRAATRGEEAA
jgi:hypothetical protein